MTAEGGGTALAVVAPLSQPESSLPLSAHERAGLSLRERCRLRDSLIARELAGGQAPEQLLESLHARTLLRDQGSHFWRASLQPAPQPPAADPAAPDTATTTTTTTTTAAAAHSPTSGPVAASASGPGFARVSASAAAPLAAPLTPSPIRYFTDLTPDQLVGAAVSHASDKLGALREVFAAALLHGDTDTLALLASHPLAKHELGRPARYAPLLADLAVLLVRGEIDSGLVDWMFKSHGGAFGSWLGSDAPYMAVAVAEREEARQAAKEGGAAGAAAARAARVPRSSSGGGAGGGGGGSRGSSLGGSTVHRSRLVELLELFHVLGFAFAEDGGTFLRAMDLLSRDMVDEELLDWLLAEDCCTGPAGWAHVVAVRLHEPTPPAVFGGHSALAYLERRKLAPGPDALALTHRASRDVFEGFVSYVVVQHRCPHSPAQLYQLAVAGDRADQLAGGGRAAWLTQQGLAPGWCSMLKGLQLCGCFGAHIELDPEVVGVHARIQKQMDLIPAKALNAPGLRGYAQGLLDRALLQGA
ncbi:hypothetical protein HYH02_005623 [Chlamydomonas schloesseri]|uniref:Uncharacterized protein n=1 Tax=Chlamydomonas schloesseri TaxID=2026947 RepID=A0A835WLL3_9CHLO|nr:hypothetical protein HYH02_005623 [Chlamydomonas schloesseri]|eukprot:KAG2449479.1 hypothetical protein HYH02_005623 [Chlamydomonas schloesseri]